MAYLSRGFSKLFEKFFRKILTVYARRTRTALSFPYAFTRPLTLIVYHKSPQKSIYKLHKIASNRVKSFVQSASARALVNMHKKEVITHSLFHLPCAYSSYDNRVTISVLQPHTQVICTYLSAWYISLSLTCAVLPQLGHLIIH